MAGAAAGVLVEALAGAGISREHADIYAEAIRRGGTLITVRAEADEQARICEVVERHDPVDIDERAESWRDAAVPEATTTSGGPADHGVSAGAVPMPTGSGMSSRARKAGGCAVKPTSPPAATRQKRGRRGWASTPRRGRWLSAAQAALAGLSAALDGLTETSFEFSVEPAGNACRRVITRLRRRIAGVARRGIAVSGIPAGAAADTRGACIAAAVGRRAP